MTLLSSILLQSFQIILPTYRTRRTQKDIVVDALKSGEEVTRYKMLPYGIVRLEHYIWLLRKAGMDIRGNWHTDREGKRYKEYRLAPDGPWGYLY